MIIIIRNRAIMLDFFASGFTNIPVEKLMMLSDYKTFVFRLF